MFNFLAIIANLLNFAIPIILLVLIVCLIISIFLRIKIRVTDTKERANKRIIKVIIWSIIVVGIWAYLGSLNSTFDGDPPIITKYGESVLQPIKTTTNDTFILKPGQAAIIGDIEGKVIYTGWESGAWVNGPTYTFEYIQNGKPIIINQDSTLYGEYIINYLGKISNEYNNKDVKFIVKKLSDVIMNTNNLETTSETGEPTLIKDTKAELITEIDNDPTVTPKEEVGEISNKDKNKQIMYWLGKVNLHLENDTWTTDPDGFSGATIDKLEYCKKWYPKTVAVGENELTWSDAWRNGGNTGSFTSEKMSYYCLQK
ncbi:MAG: Gamma-D-glutamyl-(L)-meso-diaminopimelate peptidase [Patescibacteria group bacterium]|jgi:hypothetical protein|nr:Gamma-D-glutamyl-(L)-meso-diaminopimelate peptidase [Patescibacteria group bacterium]